MRISGIDFLRRAHSLDVGQANTVQLHRANTVPRQVGQLPQVLGATLGDRIGKRRHRRTVEAQGHAFDFDVGRPFGVIKAEIDTTVFLTISHFTLEPGKTVQLGDDARPQRFFDQTIGSGGIHAKQPPLRGFTDLPGARQLAFRVVGATEPDLPAFDLTIEHRACVRAVNGQQFAANGFDIGEKTLVTSDQAPFFEGRMKTHQPCQLRNPRAMRSTASCKRARFCV
ncbi:hypothetical protein D3C73_835860 [compost metagenome]